MAWKNLGDCKVEFLGALSGVERTFLHQLNHS